MDRELEKLSDGELFAMLSGDEKQAGKAFDEIYTRYSPRVFAYCRRFLGNREEAEDAFQETFVKFFNSRGDGRTMTNLVAYLLKIARNFCLNLRRIEKNIRHFDESMVIEQDGREDRDELLNLIKMALDLLPEDYREMFVLREYDGLSYSDIAEITHSTVQTVKIRLHRAKEKIRQILAPYLTDMLK